MFPAKPSFGQSSTATTFGGGFGTSNMNSPFGQSTFGKTTTSGFTAPAFGSSSTSLFGSNTSTAGGLFGGGTTATPVFGQAQTTQPSAFGFGTNTTSNSLFGSQQNANTSLFGGNTTSAFGQNKPAFGSFVAPSTGLFGQQQQPQTSLFGQPSASTGTGLFGSSGGFGTTSNQTLGTPIKFVPATGTDTMSKSGVTQTINTRHHCITCMKEYESKSLEELRLEDYALNRKGPQQATQQPGLFGASTQPSLFGSGTSTSAGGSSLFGDNKPLFSGTTTMGFGSSTGVFGSTAQQPTSLFSKPAGFGAVTTTAAPGFAFNTTTTSNPFGATAQAKPFGTVAPQANLFGAAQPQPTGFGTPNTGFGAFGNQQNQSIGLFNQNKSPFTMNTTSTGFTFGQNTATNQTTNLFGKPATGSTAFGSTTGFGTGTGFGGGNMFGNTPSTSLFTSSTFGKPNNTGFSFGGQTTPATSGLGTGLNLGGQSLFGNTANKPGGLFGGGSTMFGSGGGTGFGTTNNFGLGTGLGTSLGLGGSTLLGGASTNTMTSQQGTVSVHEQILALASMPFGDTPLFRNLLPAASKADSLKPANTATHKVTPKSASFTTQYKVTPRSSSKIRVKPISTSQLSKKALFDGLDDIPPELENFSPLRGTKRLVLKMKHNAAETSSSPVISAENTNSYQESDKENNDIPSEQQPVEDSWLFNKGGSPNREEEFQRSELHSPKRNLEHSFDRSLEQKGQRSTKSSLNSESVKEKSNESSSGSEYYNVADESQEADDFGPVQEQPPHPTGIVLTRVGYYTIPSMEELTSLISEDGKCVVDNFTVGREGYGNVYFPESFDVSGLNLDEIVHFRHKEVVLYPDDDKKPPVGEGLNRRAQVTLDRVWPMDKSTHEPITNPERLLEMQYEYKLQRVCAKLQTRFLEYRSQTGSWVFKVEHFSKYGLSDSDEEDTTPAGTGKQLKPGQKPLAVRVAPPGATAPTKQVLALDDEKYMNNITYKEPAGLMGTFLPGALSQTASGLTPVPVLVEEDQDMEDVPKHPMVSFDDNGDVMTSPTARMAREWGSSSHKLQLMKASFFMDDDLGADYLDFTPYEIVREKVIDDLMEKELPFADLSERSFNLIRTHFNSPQTMPMPIDLPIKASISPKKKRKAVASVQAVIPLVEHPKTVPLKYPSHVLHWEQTSSYKIRANCAVDLNLFKGQGFRVGWGADSTLLTLTTQQMASTQPLVGDLTDLWSYTCGRSTGDHSPSIVQRLRVVGGGAVYEENFLETVENHLLIQLQHSELLDEAECPRWVPSSGVLALHAHCIAAESIAAQSLAFADKSTVDSQLTYATQVWKLCVALWGNLPSLAANSEPISHHVVMMRREALSEWLESVILPGVNEETAHILGRTGDPSDKESHVSAVLSYLSAKQIMEACEKAQGSGDNYAVMLLAQISGSQLVRQLINRQLAYWQEVKADMFIGRERLKLYMLMAGIPLFSSQHGTVNVCENLDWKRAFAMHLWYICSPIASITDALQKYESAFMEKEEKNNYAKRPIPPYIYDESESESSGGQPIYDMCYHLLKLYSCHSHSLEKLLNPATHTPDPLDYRLSWLVCQVLDALGYSHISDYCAAHINSNYALQLESQGLWHWAIFALLHLKDPLSRKAAVLDMLGRHIELSDRDSYLDKEDFLTDKLQVPLQWIYEAKATLASVQQEYSKAAWYLMKAGHFNEGHDIIMKHIAADSIVNENYEYLRCLLEPLVNADPVHSVAGWNDGGQILWDYLQVVSEIQKLMSKPMLANSYQLEKLQPLLTSLCKRINLLPCPTAKDRLCQSEIALRTAHLVRNVLQLQKGETGVSSRVLAHLVSQLPLPEDYTRDELNQVVRSMVTEFIPE